MHGVGVTNSCKDFLLDQMDIQVKPQFVIDGRKGRLCSEVEERISILISLLLGVSG